MKTAQKSEFVLLLETIEKDKGIPRQEILRLIEGAVCSALHKHLGRELPVKTDVSALTGEIATYLLKKAAVSVEDPLAQITFTEAKKINPQCQLDEEIAVRVETEDFYRIAAQTAKQVILQKLREVEKENLFKDFKKKESLIITGSVYRVASDKTIFVSLGKTEALLKREDQIPGERFSIGEVLKALVRSVEPSLRGPQVFLSRASTDFVKALLRLEVPEVHDRTIEVVRVAREPGFRSKVLVKSNNERVDAVGSCVGIRGTRIKPIIQELHGEKIDLINASDKTQDLIASSLAPAKVEKVEVQDQEKQTAIVFVSEDQAPGAIGKDGVNLKLAQDLTGWNIAVKISPKEKANEATPEIAVSKEQES